MYFGARDPPVFDPTPPPEGKACQHVTDLWLFPPRSCQLGNFDCNKYLGVKFHHPQKFHHPPSIISAFVTNCAKPPSTPVVAIFEY